MPVKELMKKALSVEANLLYKLDSDLLVLRSALRPRSNNSSPGFIRLDAPDSIVKGYSYAVIPANVYAETADTNFDITQPLALSRIDGETKDLVIEHAPPPFETNNFFRTCTPAFILCENKPTSTPFKNPTLETEGTLISTFLPIKDTRITDEDLLLHRDIIQKMFPSLNSDESLIKRPWMGKGLIALNVACVKHHEASLRHKPNDEQSEDLSLLIKNELEAAGLPPLSKTALDHCIQALKLSNRQDKIVVTLNERNRYHPGTSKTLIKMNELARTISVDPNRRNPITVDYIKERALNEETLPKRYLGSLAHFMIPDLSQAAQGQS